jgi:hypothetical protein
MYGETSGKARRVGRWGQLPGPPHRLSRPTLRVFSETREGRDDAHRRYRRAVARGVHLDMGQGRGNLDVDTGALVPSSTEP